MSDVRDSTNRALLAGQQEMPRAELVKATTPAGRPGSFTVVDRWVQVISLNPQQATGTVNLATEGGSFVVSDEPFYVAGPRTFVNATGADLYVQTASRRELLSRLPLRDYAANGAAFAEVYSFSGAVGFLTVATDWLYLGADLVWRQATIGSTPAGMPFGRNAPDKNIAGRYYEIDFAFTVDVGAPNLQLVRNMGTFKQSTLVSGTGTPNNGNVRVGDTYSGPTGPAALTQTLALGSGLWTLALVNNVNATFTFGELSVIRQGF